MGGEAGGDWRKARERALERLRAHLERGLVDRDIAGFLLELNELKQCLFTTSSCSGRVVVLEAADFFDKHGASMLASWHDPVECLEGVRRFCSYTPGPGRIAWASLQPPILHVAAANEGVARRLARCGDEAGFARSCYKPYRAGGYVVELAGADKLHLVLPAPCGLLEALCRVLAEYKRKLSRLKECLLRVEC